MQSCFLSETSAVVSSEVTPAAYHQVPVESFAEVLLRAGKLAEAKTEVFPTTEGKAGCSHSEVTGPSGEQ